MLGFSVLIVRQLRLFILELHDLSGVNYTGYVLIFFALTLPMTISFRIVARSMNDIILNNDGHNTNYIVILSAVYIQLTSYNNYKLSNICLSNIQLIMYILFPVFMILEVTFNRFSHSVLPYDLNHTGNITSKYNAAYSFDEISYPPHRFARSYNLNPSLAKTLNQMAGQYTPVPRQTGIGTSNDYRIMHNDDFWIRTNNDTFYKESYIKGRFSASNATSLAPPINFGYQFSLSNSDYWGNRGIRNKIIDMEAHGNEEYKVDAVTATMLPFYFGVNNGYGFSPQAELVDEKTGSRYKADMIVDYDNKPILVVENKAFNASDS
jgi:hypothetical protein